MHVRSDGIWRVSHPASKSDTGHDVALFPLDVTLTEGLVETGQEPDVTLTEGPVETSH